MKPSRPPEFTVMVAFVESVPAPTMAAGLFWREIPNGTYLTPDASLQRAKRHVREFAGCVAMVRRDGVNRFYVARGEAWDMSGDRPERAL